LSRKNFSVNPDLTLLDLLSDMNSSTARAAYKPLKETPKIGQVVISPFTDHNFYRAKVLNVKGETTEVSSLNLVEFLK
jgi:hypothetical protein